MSTLTAHPLLTTYASMFLLWLFYIQIMGALRVWNELHWIVKAHLLLPTAAFVMLDVAVNITIGTLLFIEPPRWWTLSERLNYHAIADHGWRTFIARWICTYLLNPFDPDGHHCGAK